MPIPFLVYAGLAAAGVLGLGGHLSAKEKNEKANEILSDAKKVYDEEKKLYDKEENKAEKALTDFGSAKKDVINGSMVRFLNVYEKVKDVNLKGTECIDELSQLAITESEIVQIQKLSSIYRSAVPASIGGLTLGHVIGKGLSHFLIPTAGLTPLLTFFGPVTFLTAFAADNKADENLEIARTKYAEAEKAVEEMKTGKLLCQAISEKAKMLTKLLSDVDEKFLKCIELLENCLDKKPALIKEGKADITMFSRSELELIAVARALAGAVRTILDTAILSEKGKMAEDEKYKVVERGLPYIENQMEKLSL